MSVKEIISPVKQIKHDLNNSPAKLQYSFGKAKRFVKHADPT